MDRFRQITTLPSRLVISALTRRNGSEVLITAIARYGLIFGVARESWRRVRQRFSAQTPDLSG